MKLKPAVIALLAATPFASHAAVNIYFTQDGNDVVATFSGSINLGSLEVFDANILNWPTSSGISAAAPMFYSIATSTNVTSYYGADTNFDGIDATPYGDGFGRAPSVGPGNPSGDVFGFTANRIILASDYVSGSNISGSMIFLDRDFEDLGLLTGTYLTTWGSGAPDNLITVTVVPEPHTYAAIAGLGVLGLALWRRRKA